MTASNGHSGIKIPAPTLTIIHIILAILLAWLAPLPIPAPTFVRNIGLGLAMLGFILGILALREFKRVRSVKKSARSLITSGIYHYTRNPVYLGFVFVLIGLPLSMGTYWGVILAWPLVILTNNLIIKHEEAWLAKEFNKEFQEYTSRVRRWL
jgi:protein-S-isoprenylcysteine O-methyltransferase Ste14